MRKKKILPLIPEVEITALAAEGKALSRIDDMVLFVPFAVPGDVADVQVTRKKHHYMEGRMERLRQPSVHRVEPFCPNFGVCGGCQWQCLDYAQQLVWKRQQVVDAIERIGKIQGVEVLPTLPSPHTRAYRNKLEFGFSCRRWLTPAEVAEGAECADRNALGFHISGAFDKILDIRECHLMDDVQNRLRNFIHDYASAHGLAFDNVRAGEGLLRNMMVRYGGEEGGLMLLIQFRINTADERAQALDLMQHVADEFPEITSLLYVDNHKGNETIGDQKVEVFRGADHIFLRMGNLKFKVGPKSFYQTNTLQAQRLYDVAADMAGLTGKELVYDLYTGTGTIANYLAAKAQKVVGIEYVPEAIDDAKENSRVNHIDNTRFYAGDMKDLLTDDFVAREGHPDVIVTDPPRTGMHPDVVDMLLRIRAPRVVYVSCNPATQARDLASLAQAYTIVRTQPVDMFPHTAHVENVALLLLRTDTDAPLQQPADTDAQPAEEA